MNDTPPNARPILEEDLHAYVDNALDAQRRRDVQQYLADHPDAAREVAAFARDRHDLRAAVASVAEEPVPPSLNLPRLIAEHQQQHAQREDARRRWPWSMAAAVLLSLSVGAGTGWTLRGGAAAGDAGIFALANEATRSYEIYASDKERPVEMGPSQRAELVRWVSQRLGRKVAIPDLGPSGYRFMGGRLVMTEHGPAGLFMYDDAGGKRIALMVRPMSVDKNTPVMRRIEGPRGGFAWADQGLGYGVVGATDPALLHPVANEMRRQIGVDLVG